MNFISYAQNFEDVMLWRALKNVEDGSYIDIGAQDPLIDSVSLAFHQRGWHGLHIEPNSYYADALRKERTGDQVLQVAVGKEPGQISFYEFEGTGLSTGCEQIACQHEQQGHQAHKVDVEVVTLDQLLEDYQQRTLHWLKIDVEGMEADVIAGWRQSSVRPWLVVVESSRPGSQDETHHHWEAALLAKGYQPVYYDGVNRYYLSNAQPQLAAAFAAPPNVFDEFSLSGHGSHAFCLELKHQVHLVEVRAAEAEAAAFNANRKIVQLQAQLASLNVTLDMLYSSRSWRITAPLRSLVDWLRSSPLLFRPLARTRQILRDCIGFLRKSPTPVPSHTVFGEGPQQLGVRAGRLFRRLQHAADTSQLSQDTQENNRS